MISPNYELWLTDDRGTRRMSLDRALWFQASRQVNRVGHFQMGLWPGFDEQALHVDHMVQVWRQPPGGRMGLWRTYFVRGWRLSHAGGQDQIQIWGPDSNDLLRRRIVAHYAGAAESDYTNEYADDLMKDLVTNATATGATNPAPTLDTRDWDGFRVAADLSAGPQLDKGCAWKPLLTLAGGGVLGQVAEAAREAGTEVFFDVVPDVVTGSSITFLFRTYTGQPGRDVRERVLFCQEDGTLAEPFVEYDYTEEANYVWAGGEGEEDEREIAQVYELDRMEASRWNRCEAFADARDQKTADGVEDAGNALLEASRPVIRAGGIPLDTPSTRFGQDWDVGDRVRMRYRRRMFDALVAGVVLSMDDGEETVDARLDYAS